MQSHRSNTRSHHPLQRPGGRTQDDRRPIAWDPPVRIFTVASNKKNMRRHQNERAGKIPSKQWFYNWLVRILMERLTDWCLRYSQKHKLPRRHVKLMFSQSGGHSYSQTAAYHELLKVQGQSGTYLKKWVPRSEVMSMHLVEAHPHYAFAGLQLADIAASSFYQAVDNLDTGPCNTRHSSGTACCLRRKQ